MGLIIRPEDKQWVEHELSFYKGSDSCVQQEDILIGYQRIAFIFQCLPHKIHAEDRFGIEIHASIQSSWLTPSEFDKIIDDINDFEILLPPNKKIDKERITCVKDYVLLLAQCRIININDYQKLITDWQNERNATTFGRLIKRWFGVLPKYFVREKRIV